ncbi:MAG TPA: NADH-quinone oxidoreductase subunit NuoN [Burkholderiaceae bacterium]|nr:NADH-quinone oxidoreductase subunit NuoN [Burkholderiaceae bacterium]
MNDLNVLAALPEILLLVAACAVLLVDVLAGADRPLRIDRVALAVLLLPAAATVWQIGQPAQFAFGGAYVADALGHVLKLAAIVATGATIVYARGYATDRGMHRGELYALALFSLLGIMVMISAANLLVVYLGFELMSLSLYALAAMRRDHPVSTEAAIKYFVLGALASGFLLYGMSMLYGGTGTLDLARIASAIANGTAGGRTVIVFGVVFVVAGLAFKLGAVPFHMWVPDVYQGTPTVATLLIAGAPKLATFAVAFRLLVQALPAVAIDWQQMLLVLSVLSMLLGNLVAIAQTNLKRMLAYSTIAQVGFVLLGMLSGTVGADADGMAAAWSASLFYVVTYVLTTLGSFGVIMLVARHGHEAEEIDDLRGLSRRAPGLAFVILILMFSLTGIPPTVGFYAKLAVLQAVVDAGLVWLAIAAVLLSLIGAFYYLRIVKTMYFDEPTDTAAIAPYADARALMAVNGAAVLLLGIVPGPLMALCFDAIRQVLGG